MGPHFCNKSTLFWTAVLSLSVSTPSEATNDMPAHSHNVKTAGPSFLIFEPPTALAQFRLIPFPYGRDSRATALRRCYLFFGPDSKRSRGRCRGRWHLRLCPTAP